MLEEIFHDSFKISTFTRICMENHLSVTMWQESIISSVKCLCESYNIIYYNKCYLARVTSSA